MPRFRDAFHCYAMIMDAITPFLLLHAMPPCHYADAVTPLMLLIAADFFRCLRHDFSDAATPPIDMPLRCRWLFRRH